MKGKELENYIVKWLKDYNDENSLSGFVIGVSGGIDSSVVSTLCAKTGYPVLVISMPINTKEGDESLSDKHINFLKEKFDNVESLTIDLTSTYNTMRNVLDIDSYRTSKEGVNVDLSLANTQSRLRMVTLYSYANTKGYIVCGTGNKVEDFGIGFFTKGGDGMVDVSPIGDLMKSEVYKLGEHLGIIDEIINTEPTDGLWEGSPTDEDQIGASYDELEWAMKWTDMFDYGERIELLLEIRRDNLTDRQSEVLDIYINRHKQNKHKVKLPPVCEIPRSQMRAK